MYPVSLTTITAPLRKTKHHIVQPGETAKTIAMRFYGNGLYARQILFLNGGFISPGQVILLP